MSKPIQFEVGAHWMLNILPKCIDLPCIIQIIHLEGNTRQFTLKWYKTLRGPWMQTMSLSHTDVHSIWMEDTEELTLIASAAPSSSIVSMKHHWNWSNDYLANLSQNLKSKRKWLVFSISANFSSFQEILCSIQSHDHRQMQRRQRLPPCPCRISYHKFVMQSKHASSESVWLYSYESNWISVAHVNGLYYEYSQVWCNI